MYNTFNGDRIVCLPLSSLISAINQTNVDFLSLRTGAVDMDLVENINFSQYKIKVVSFEYDGEIIGMDVIREHMASNGYKFIRDIKQINVKTFTDAGYHIYAKL